jgi:chemotaxis protein MotA
VIAQLLELNKKATVGVTALNDVLPSIKNEFLKEAVALVAGGVLSERELRATLEMRLKTVESQLMHEANMFRTIGRFPPAFGLLATTLGMIALLSKLGQPGAEKLIGPAMSIGLVGTLYGIALANFVFLPIGENLTEKTKEEVVLRKMILEGALLLKQQVNPVTLRENLNSFLPPNQRINKRAA